MASGHEIAMGLRAAYRSMHRRTEAHLAQHGMTADQFVLLSLLAEEDRVTQQSLVQRATSDPNTIRAMLMRMERRGLIVRQKHPGDGRALCITLTPAGRRAYGRLCEEIKSLQDRLSALFDAPEAEALLDGLARIAASMAKARKACSPSKRRAG